MITKQAKLNEAYLMGVYAAMNQHYMGGMEKSASLSYLKNKVREFDQSPMSVRKALIGTAALGLGSYGLYRLSPYMPSWTPEGMLIGAF